MLFTEIVCFEKLMQNMLKRLPKDKFMENALKMRRCLRRVTLMSSTERLETITSKLNIPQSISVSLKECIKDILVNVKDVAHLLTKTMHYCEQSFSFLLQKLKVGHLLDSLVMSTGVLSRIYVLCKCRVVNICQQYEEVIHIFYKEEKEADIIMKSSGLPISLKDCIEKEADITSNRSFDSKRKEIFLDQMYESDGNGSNNLLPTEDIGEPVPRDSIETEKSAIKNCSPAKMNELKKEFSKIKTLKALRSLYKKLRFKTSVYTDVLSQPLSLHQLQKIKKIVKRTANEIQRLKSKSNFNRQHIINSAAVEMFNVITL